jgi:hypothetical protein
MTHKRSIDPSQQHLAHASQTILAALQGIRFGAVEIVIHDGRIVQIERKEKLRLEVNTSPQSS